MKASYLSPFLILSIVFAFSHLSNAALTCGTVDQKAVSCATFATGKDAKPKPACCSGLQALAGMVKNVNDKKAICRCLKSGLKSFPGVQDKLLGQIPSACKIKVGFPVSINTNCETIH